MLRVHLHDLGQGVRPVVLGLAGQTVHQIQADVVKAGVSGILKCLLGLLEIVPAADQLQQAVVRGLHADGQAVDPLLPQQLQGGGADAVRVALHCDLRIQPHIAVELQLVQNIGDPVRPVEAGGAAAEVDAVHLVVSDGVGGLLDVLQQRLLILRHQVVAVLQRVKVAVAALTGAEGDMDVDSQPWFHSAFSKRCVFSISRKQGRGRTQNSSATRATKAAGSSTSTPAISSASRASTRDSFLAFSLSFS